MKSPSALPKLLLVGSFFVLDHDRRRQAYTAGTDYERAVVVEPAHALDDPFASANRSRRGSGQPKIVWVTPLSQKLAQPGDTEEFL